MGKPTSMSAKAEEIRRILSEPVVDLWTLREMALTEGGLVNDSLRKLAWPKLVGVNNEASHDHSASSSSLSQPVPPTDQIDPPNSLDAEQITRDVSRVTWHLLTGNQRSRNFQMKNKHRKRVQTLLKKKQKRLGDFLNLVLVQSYGDVEDMEGNDRLRYYQGFHDVASIVLMALGGASTVEMTIPVNLNVSFYHEEEGRKNSCEESKEDGADEAPNSARRVEEAHKAAASMGLTLACQVLLQLTQSHLRDAMRANFQQLNAALRLIIMPLTAAFDPEVHSHLYDCEMEPFFALSWIITWFSHDVRDTAIVKRLFDFFLVSHPMMSIYMSVAMMIHPLNRIEVLGTDCDFACVHHALADLPKNSSNVGWKYTPNDEGSSGYVSGEDDDISLDASLLDQSCDDPDDDGSIISSSVLNNSRTARVPFQELIDLSISLMHKIPPRNLLNLAQRYHTEITLQPLMAEASSIALLQPPPSWGLATCADSDWVIRQKIREECGIRLNRHQRRNRFKLANGVEPRFGGSTPTTEEEDIELRKKILNIGKPPMQAIIASGTGPDGRAEARKFKKQRRIMVRSVAIVVLSIFVALVKPYFSSRTSVSLKDQPSTTDEYLSREICEGPGSSQQCDEDAGSHDQDRKFEDNDETKRVFGDQCDTGPDGGEDLAQGAETILENEEDGQDLCADDDESTYEDGFDADLEEEEVKPLTELSQYVETNEPVMNLVKLPAIFAMKTLLLVWVLRENIADQLLSISHRVFGMATHIQPYVEFLMEQFIKVLHISWHNADAAWSKFAPVLQNELMSDLDGVEVDSARSAMQTWERQGEMYRNQWKKLVRMISNARKASKGGK
mmetsp:Transcript_15250/g.29297  ORF Transcript_15250/g.29297 Transcript_15250/m.29297 type:complete len:843 (+) Transcript_15250:676-3204(+)|eukprot:CAMPEP_0171338946 /NCGR_PEP_ID=MMETSP0878-20121228/7645_1 /TAXON_ID=67004 /ORGANISM="Thalassiosira weissflogii, Strain CCMP1336" /LENGTH=842 /DNA_ID=CAMNT_0011840789 /DNA_START=520 /DNA_END=3048 /DNA_ORIENTATION=+